MSTPTSDPNAELAYAILDHIDANPQAWDQGVYLLKTECGTVACFAGWACLLSGDTPMFFVEPGERSPEMLGILAEGSVPRRAQELLRVSRWIDDTREDLFSTSNTREDLGRMVEKLFGPRPQVSASPENLSAL